MKNLDQNISLESALESSHILANVLRVKNLFSIFHDLLLIILSCGAIRFSYSESTAVTVAVTNAVGGNCCIVSRSEEIRFN